MGKSRVNGAEAIVGINRLQDWMCGDRAYLLGRSGKSYLMLDWTFRLLKLEESMEVRHVIVEKDFVKIDKRKGDD